MKSLSRIIKANPIRSFIVLTYCWSWLIWSGLYFVIPDGMYSAPGVPNDLPPSFILFFIAGGIGPSLIGLLLTGIISGKGDVVNILLQLRSWRFSGMWIPAVLFTAPAIALAARFLQFNSGYEVPDILKLSGIIPALFMGLIAGLLEEFGWRGFLLPRLLERFHPFIAGLTVGIPWGIWHSIPAYWGIGSVYGSDFWLYFLIADLSNLIAFSVLIAFTCNSVRDRIQLAILFHASMSASINIFLSDLPTKADTIRLLGNFSVAAWAAVIIAAIVFRFNTMNQKHQIE
ncbi:MAG: family intrarane metalloprotease [Bacillota bacterium]|nr:family intrarane metalloprotease [Bacillota bacterium]